MATTGMKLTDLVDAIVALGDPENDDPGDGWAYTDDLETLLYDGFGFELTDNIIMSVDDHGEARKLSIYQKEDTVIGLEYEIHPEWGITSVYKPYFMKPQVVTTYVFDRPVF